VKLANLFQLDAEAMSQRAFGPQFIEERLGLIECVWWNVLALEKIAKAALNFRFG
jgi:hypothetical protein